MWLVQLGLHFGADLVMAYITTHAAGYDQDTRPQTWDLALFYASRPRMAWICLSFIGKYKLKIENSSRTPTASAERIRSENTRLSSRSGNRSDKPLVESFDVEDGGPVEGYWTSAAKQTMIVEGIMQIVGTYYLGRTAHFATTHGYYLPNRHYDSNARLMYGGALFTLIFTYISLIGLGTELYQFITRKPPSFAAELEVPSVAFAFGYAAYIGSWLFWSGYVKLVGDMYVCPFLIL